jgi:predicted transcriptional regulator
MTPKQLRKKIATCGETMEQLALKTGVTYSWLSKFKLGKFANPRPATIAKLVEYFK